MNPRLKSSKKWTAFPAEYTQQIQKVFNENFAQFLDEAEFLIEGRIYPEEILLRVGYHREGILSQANFEVSMNYSQKDQDAISRIHNCVDAAASLMLEYLEADANSDSETGSETGSEPERALDLPYLWKEIPFQGMKLYVQFTTENSSLEAQANALLGIEDSNLLNDQEELNEDALAHAELDEELSPARDEGYESDNEDKGPPQTTENPKTPGVPPKKEKNRLH